MRKKAGILLGLVVLSVALFLAAGCGAQQAPPQDKQAAPAASSKAIKIRLTSGMPEGMFQHKEVEEFARLVNERSQGALQVEHYPRDQLYKEADAVEAVISGAIEMAVVPKFHVARVVPLMRLFELPGLVKDPETYNKIYDGEIGKKIEQVAETKGMKLLAWSDEAAYFVGVGAKKPIYVPADLKGMNLRATSPTDAKLFQLCGANPTTISGSEQYMAYQRGVIEGGLLGISQIRDRKLYEVLDYLTDLRITDAGYLFLVNKKFFNGLPAPLQQQVAGAAREVTQKYRGAWVKQSNAYIEEMKAKGFTCIKPTPEQWAAWQKVFAQVYESIYKDVPELQGLVAEARQLEK